MSFAVWSWVMIALIVFGVGGLLASAFLHISSSVSRQALTSARSFLLAIGIIGVVGLGAMAFGVFPLGHPDNSTLTNAGVGATGKNGIITQSR